mgnify:CR=1 FL=1|jgi:outer membrane lipoprotein SlyB
MHTLTRIGVPLALVAALAACASVPSGPSMLVLPGTGKSFDQFRGDDAMCRQYAQQQTGASPQEVADASGVRSAALGTAIGAVAGAAVGGSRGAAVGAGGGLLVGSASGAGAAQVSASGMQRRYDHAYVQCMYAQGHRVPVAGQMSGPSRSASPSSYRSIPPPPPGQPPAPPPGVSPR